VELKDNVGIILLGVLWRWMVVEEKERIWIGVDCIMWNHYE
jgi:hypothetical protein